ncbi:hypothetical protein NA57DRAFT_82014 [Rhizodiscina lignyota]|uniref:Uncharacterized protein n=1 Tax=Rhizodiscina lignyota TaxID=1504668 RepID=A0A9P4I0E2_9PEZI|nr:hypothetical protein NA57DRAFT_82014 [Rhizodiscina lignyota]
MQSPPTSRPHSPSRLTPAIASLDQMLKSPHPVEASQPLSDELQPPYSPTSTRKRPRKLEVDTQRTPKEDKSERETTAEAEPHALDNPAGEQTPLRRRPRKLNREPAVLLEIRAESNGGVAIGEESPATPAINTIAPAETPTQPQRDEETASQLKHKDAEPEQQQPMQRRRPRKLNRNRSANAVSGPQPASTDTSQVPNAPVQGEIEALKARVRDLESQVRELYERPQAYTARSPRRRGKGRKSSQDATGAPNEELAKLQEELVIAQNELAALRVKAAISPTPAAAPTRSTQPPTATPSPRHDTRQNSWPRTRPRPKRDVDSDNDVEDVHRTGVPTVDGSDEPSQRAVTLSGNYKIRLPDSLNMNDVRAIQDGVASASNIARTLAANRASSAVNSGPHAAGTDRDGVNGGKSWSEWFGSYSSSIARLMHNVEADAAVQSTPISPRTAGNPRAVKRKLPLKRSTMGQRAQGAPSVAASGEHTALVRRAGPSVLNSSTDSPANETMVDGLMN